jgi:hypothetical protein
LSVTCGRSVVISGYSGFLHQYNWPPQYKWNIAEGGVKHQSPNHNPEGITGHFAISVWGFLPPNKSDILVSNTYCVVFFFVFFSVLCFVYPILPFSLDWPFLIALSVLSIVYSRYSLQSAAFTIKINILISNNERLPLQ